MMARDTSAIPEYISIITLSSASKTRKISDNKASKMKSCFPEQNASVSIETHNKIKLINE